MENENLLLGKSVIILLSILFIVYFVIFCIIDSVGRECAARLHMSTHDPDTLAFTCLFRTGDDLQRPKHSNL